MRHKNQTNQILYQTSKILYDHFRGKQGSKPWSDNGVISASTDHIWFIYVSQLLQIANFEFWGCFFRIANFELPTIYRLQEDGGICHVVISQSRYKGNWQELWYIYRNCNTSVSIYSANLNSNFPIMFTLQWKYAKLITVQLL